MYDFKKPGIHLIARMMTERNNKENPTEIEYLREVQTSNTKLIVSGRVFVTENVYVYYTFVEVDPLE